jgi:zinc protease
VVEQFDDEVEEIDVLVESPTPVEEVERNDLDKNNGFELVFDNGARVLFSESDISEEQVVLVSESPGGRSMLSDDDGPIASAAIAAVASSGLGPWDPIQVRRYLADLEVSLSPYLADFSEGFSGASSTRDLEDLFELLHLSLTSPRVDDVPFSQQLELARDAVERAALDSGTAANIAVSDARTGGGALAALPTPAQLDALTPNGAQRIWDARFGSLDEHVIVVVGDVDPDTVIDLSRRWIGTLPDATSEDDPAQPPLPGVVNERLAVGSGTSGGSFRLLSIGEADESISNRVLAEVATSILNDRLFTVVREQLGATYGGSAQIEFSEPGNEIEVLISVDGDPDRIDEIADTVALEFDELRSGSLTQADFNEAVSILRSEYGFISNGFIIESLFDEAYQPATRVLDRTAQLEALNQLASDDVTNFLVSAVSDSNRIDIRNTP